VDRTFHPIPFFGKAIIWLLYPVDNAKKHVVSTRFAHRRCVLSKLPSPVFQDNSSRHFVHQTPNIGNKVPKDAKDRKNLNSAANGCIGSWKASSREILNVFRRARSADSIG
jgi:hypothetical protein